MTGSRLDLTFWAQTIFDRRCFRDQCPVCPLTYFPHLFASNPNRFISFDMTNTHLWYHLRLWYPPKKEVGFAICFSHDSEIMKAKIQRSFFVWLFLCALVCVCVCGGGVSHKWEHNCELKVLIYPTSSFNKWQLFLSLLQRNGGLTPSLISPRWRGP